MLREMGLPNRKKITLSALRLIPNLRDQGLSADEIADAVGCTVGTLRVKCSQMGISLRRKKRNTDGTSQKNGSHQAVSRRADASEQNFVIALSRKVIDNLQNRAATRGISHSTLVAMLLEVIARDDLYAAVIDSSEDAEALTQPGKLLD